MGHPPSCPVSFLLSPPSLPIPYLSLCCCSGVRLPLAFGLWSFFSCLAAVLCFVACSALRCLLLCVPGLGYCVLSPPPSKVFFPLFCLLVVCSLARFLPSLSFLLFPRCWLWLAVLVPSLFPFPPLVCVKPQTKPGILARIRLLLTNVWSSALQISQTLLTFLSDEIETFEL